MEQRMKQHKSRSMRSLVGAGAFFLMMSDGRATFAQQTVKETAGSTVAAHPATKAQVEEEETAKRDKPGEQGIKVHGHWVIDVRNPDGTLVRHKDFQNSLVTLGAAGSGDQLLAALLSGNVSVSDPGIAFVSTVAGTNVLTTDPTTYCSLGPLQSGSCSLLTTAQSLLSNSSYRNVQTGMGDVVHFSPAVNWVLSGNWTVPAGTSSVLYVQTLVPTCSSSAFGSASAALGPTGALTLVGSSNGRTADLSSSACVASAIGLGKDGQIVFPFTSTLVPNEPAGGMPVTPGQVITVTVTISFS